MDTHDNIAVWSSKFQKKTLEETKTTNYMNMTCAESFHFSQINLEVRGGSKGGAGGGSSPPYCWCINGNMGRVREKERWKKEEKELEEQMNRKPKRK